MKLQISCVVVDEKVGTDFLEEKITELEDHVSIQLCMSNCVVPLLPYHRCKVWILLLSTRYELHGFSALGQSRAREGTACAYNMAAAASSGERIGVGEKVLELDGEEELINGHTPQEGTKEHMNVVEVSVLTLVHVV